MTAGRDNLVARDGAALGVAVESRDSIRYQTLWTCEKWGEDKVDYCRRVLESQLVTHIQDGCELTEGGIAIPRMITIAQGITSDVLRELVGDPDEVQVVSGNLLLNEGLTRLRDLLIAGGGTAFNNANAFIGVGDTATAEAASQTELLATQNAANRFYKGMVASYPLTNGVAGVDWRSDFTSTEANFAWQEWTVAAGATTASGSGFLVGTTNLNRKVQSLGTKTTGTWTMTATITFS